jgi:hypothetical protein
MKRFIVLLGVMFLLSGSIAFADFGEVIVQKEISSSGDSDIPVASTDTIYTKSFSKQKAESMALMYKATSDGTVDVSIKLMQSFARPTTEGTYDNRYVTSDSIVDNLSDEAWHIATIDTLTSLPFGLYQITGNGSNDGSTTVEIETGKL